MFITKTHISRRAVLRGLGVSISLPLLDAMVPALTAQGKTAAAPVKRFGVFYVPNGMAMGYWFPKTVGPVAELPPTLQSLQKFKENVLLIGGLADEAANLTTRAGDHARSAGTFLTCVPFKAISDSNVIVSVTMDQIAAKQLAKETQIASLELALESTVMLGACDGASCALTNTISWSTETTPNPCENDPRAVFERLFGASGSTDPAARLARLERDQSVLDFVTAEVARFNRRLGPADRAKFSEYLDSVRDIERRIQKAEEQNANELPLVDQPMGIPTDYAEHAKLMMDLLAMAYQTDLTRISTFMLAREVSSRAYPEVGVSDSHHPLSHHQDEQAKLERLHKINEYHFRQFAHLVQKLASTPEGDGTMLDNTLFLYGTGISDSNTHFHDDLPIALIGGKKAGIKGGRYIRNEKGTPLANLHRTVLEMLGTPVETFGDSTGTLKTLTM
ncbi:MAG: DUF1552 domain-containing protein [Acidimicrobiia bacterium]|nr:DUF1552 domain-containing protein [Acidimicrobiia bacterium]